MYFRICELFMHHNGLLYNMTERKSPTSLVPTVRTDSLQLELSPPPVTTLRVVPKEIIKDGTLVAAAILTHNFTDSSMPRHQSVSHHTQQIGEIF